MNIFQRGQKRKNVGDFDTYWKTAGRHNRLAAAGAALRQWAKAEEKRSLSGIGRGFYTSKALLCLAFNIQVPPSAAQPFWDRERIWVAKWGHQDVVVLGDAPGVSWMELQVGAGILTGWFFAIEQQ